MSENLTPKNSLFSWKKLFFPIILLIAVFIIFFRFAELKEISQLLMSAQWRWLLAAFLAQFLIVFLQSYVYKTIFHILRFPHLKLWHLMKATVLILFMNFTIPSLGFAGNIYFLKILGKQGVKEGKGLMSVILEFVCFYSAFTFLIIGSLFYLIYHVGFYGRIAKTGIIVLPFFVLLLIFIALMTYFWLGHKDKARKRVLWFIKKLNLESDDELDSETRVENLLNDFYQDWDWIKQNKVQLIKPAILQLFKLICEGLIICLVFLSFGQSITIGLALATFAFSRLVSLMSFIPGGLVTFEGAMILVLNSFGVKLELALMVVLIYRFFSYWLYFPFGIVIYRHLDNFLNETKKYVD